MEGGQLTYRTRKRGKIITSSNLLTLFEIWVIISELLGKMESLI